MSERFVALVSSQFLADLTYWVKTDRRLALRVLVLTEECLRDPFHGAGQPEALKHWPGGAWSRRINQEHRLVYRVHEQQVEFLAARYHYG